MVWPHGQIHALRHNQRGDPRAHAKCSNFDITLGPLLMYDAVLAAPSHAGALYLRGAPRSSDAEACLIASDGVTACMSAGLLRTLLFTTNTLNP